MQQREGSRNKRFTENPFLWEDVKFCTYWNRSLDMHLSCGPGFLCLPLGSGCSHRRPGHLLFCPLPTAQEAGFQRAPKYCRKEERGNVQIWAIKVKGEVHQPRAHFRHIFCWSLKVTTSHRCQSSLMDVSVFLDRRRYQNLAHKTFS